MNTYSLYPGQFWRDPRDGKRVEIIETDDRDILVERYDEDGSDREWVDGHRILSTFELLADAQ